MDIVVPRKDLVRLLERIHPIAYRKSAVPALANVLLTAEGRVLRVAATDLYLAMSGQTECEIAQSGVVALPAKDLFERVRAMPEGPIQIATDENSRAMLKAVGQARRYTLHGLSGADFPLFPKPGDGDPLQIPGETLALLMARTHFSISTNETRAHVNSALFEWNGDRVRMVSTDGHRLSKMEAGVEGRAVLMSMLIPLKAISDLRRLVEKEPVTIRQGGPCAFFEVGGFTFSVKLVEAQFPPYQQVIPKSVSVSVRVSRVKLADTLKAIQLAASDRTGGVKLALVPGALRISSESPESGKGEDEIGVDYTGPEMQVGLNAKYVLDVLGACDCEDVILGLSGELDPMTVSPALEAPGHEYTTTIMPMRLA